MRPHRAASRRLICALFGHWPALLRMRRRHGRWTSRCMLCSDDLLFGHGGWDSDFR